MKPHGKPWSWSWRKSKYRKGSADRAYRRDLRRQQLNTSRTVQRWQPQQIFKLRFARHQSPHRDTLPRPLRMGAWGVVIVKEQP